MQPRLPLNGTPFRTLFCLQYQRSLRAIEWWQRAAVTSLDNGAFADALPLLQRAQVGWIQVHPVQSWLAALPLHMHGARCVTWDTHGFPPPGPQDVAAALERYFAQHSRSFTLMLRDQQAAAQPHVGGGSGSLPAGLPASLAGTTLESAHATHGSSLPAPRGKNNTGDARRRPLPILKNAVLPTTSMGSGVLQLLPGEAPIPCAAQPLSSPLPCPACRLGRDGCAGGAAPALRALGALHGGHVHCCGGVW